jgi:IS5 family transposase
MSTRNWKEYNNELVRRGELLLDLDFLKSWDSNLATMNSGKASRPYTYPDSFIRFLALLHVLFKLPFRQTEGFIHALTKFVPDIKKPDHATIHRRVSKLDLGLDESLVNSVEPITLAIDASGIKVANRGEWLRHKWKVRKGYLKIHFAVNTKTKEVTAFRVTTEETGDSKKFKELVDESTQKANVEKVAGDGAYDTKDNFNHLKEKGIEPAIKVRKNASTKPRGSRARAAEVKEFKRLGYDTWRKEKGYGQRWQAETAFSTYKRTFGEYVAARKFENMVNEISLKVYTYNMLINGG